MSIMAILQALRVLEMRIKIAEPVLDGQNASTRFKLKIVHCKPLMVIFLAPPEEFQELRLRALLLITVAVIGMAILFSFKQRKSSVILTLLIPERDHSILLPVPHLNPIESINLKLMILTPINRESKANILK
ncbi:hypothetical protein HOY80DRAFT_1039892 [Tuber brumale]|nr:hypothetical protein HOY80DRAFT_1039892 [Tuber brumale]